MSAPANLTDPVKTLARLCTFARGDSAELRVELQSVDGRPFVSLRLWTFNAGTWCRTPRAVTLRLSEVPRVLEALAEPGVQLAGGRRYAKPRPNFEEPLE